MAFREGEAKSASHKTIAVFPLRIASKETLIYAVVNYTDTTTVLMSEYINYSDGIVAVFDKIVIGSVTREIENIPFVLEGTLKGVDRNIKSFAALQMQGLWQTV